MNLAANTAPQSRYEMLVKIASGGMATVFVGRVTGALGFQQLVAIKRAHAHLADDETFRRMFLAEANLASRIHHANVVPVRDVELSDESIHLVMDYVEGVSLSELLSLSANVRPRGSLARVCMRILLDACAGLHAAHELSDDLGRPLGLVHRDVSPQNILVGVDGVARVVDFGIAKCMHQRDGVSTTAGTVKGKIAYMAPEYLSGRTIDRRSDIFAMGVLFWEILADQRLFRGELDAETLSRVLTYDPPPISRVASFCGPPMDAALARALAKDPQARHATMVDLAADIETAAGPGLVAGPREVAQLVQQVAGERLAVRRARVRSLIERRSDVGAGSAPELTPAPTGSRSAPLAPPPTWTSPTPREVSGAVHSKTELTAELAELAGRQRRSQSLTLIVGFVGLAGIGIGAMYAARTMTTDGTRSSADAPRSSATALIDPAAASSPEPASSFEPAPSSTSVPRPRTDGDRPATSATAPPSSVANQARPTRQPPRVPVVTRTAPAAPPTSAPAAATPRPLPSNPYQ